MGLTRAIFDGDVWAAPECRETVARIIIADARTHRGKRPSPAAEFLQELSAPLQTPRPRRPPAPACGKATQAAETAADAKGKRRTTRRRGAR